MYKTFKVLWIYSVASDVSSRFQNWMEEKHLLAIERSGYFLTGYKKLPDKISEAKNHHRFVTVYTLQPKDEASWQAFNDEVRREFDYNFSEEWSGQVNLNKIVFQEIVGFESELGNIMLSPSLSTVDRIPPHQS